MRHNHLPTPYYEYDLGLLRCTLMELNSCAQNFDYHVHYALKANVNDEILEEVLTAGLGADCVSGNEIEKALNTGFSNHQIVFAGVGKTDKEIKLALEKNIHAFNCESIHELDVINDIAKDLNLIASVALRINPNVDPQTHEFITTGLSENKFGIHPSELLDVIQMINDLDHINFIGLHFHIGSQITDLSVFSELCDRVNVIYNELKIAGITISYLNMGGGFGVNYEDPDQQLIPDFKSFFKLFKMQLNIDSNVNVHFELGRSIVAQCGSLITSVLYLKEGLEKNFLIVDAGMTELLRPALYAAYHKVEYATINKEEEYMIFDVVGPICESSDIFGKDILLPRLKRGERLKIRSTGAYGEVMSSNYNLREKVKAYYLI